MGSSAGRGSLHNCLRLTGVLPGVGGRAKRAVNRGDVDNPPCAIVFVAALMGIAMLRVPPDMNETRREGAFWFENERARRQRYLARRASTTKSSRGS